MAIQPPNKPANVSGGALAAILGVSALVATGIGMTITKHEGRVNRAYYDQAHVLTICDGDTENVRVGEVDTDAQCDARRERQLIAHAQPVIACTPSLKGHADQASAAVDLAYNIGPQAYCRSTVARLFNAGPAHWREACEHMTDWSAATAAAPIKGAISCKRVAGGRFQCILPGLVKRRQEERALCLKGLTS